VKRRRRKSAKTTADKPKAEKVPPKKEPTEGKSPSKVTTTIQYDVEKGVAAEADVSVFSQYDEPQEQAEMSDAALREEFKGARHFKDIVSTLNDVGHNDVDSAYDRLISISPEEPEDGRAGDILKRVRSGTLKSRFRRTWRLLELPGHKDITA
jgi:hypothetical protein